jgi:hypothetical protein
MFNMKKNSGESAHNFQFLIYLRLGKGKNVADSAYVPTNGFSLYEVKSKKTTTKLYDLGGSESIRELWKHYYSDVLLFSQHLLVTPGVNCNLNT